MTPLEGSAISIARSETSDADDPIQPIGVAVIDQYGKLVYMNDVLSAIIDRSTELEPLPFPRCFGMFDIDDQSLLKKAFTCEPGDPHMAGELVESVDKWHMKYRFVPAAGSTNNKILIAEFPNLRAEIRDQYIAELEDRLQVLTHYTHIISHDVRSPIQNLSILLRFLEEGKIDQQEYNSLVRKSLAGLELTLENLNWSLKQEDLRNMSVEVIEFASIFNTIHDLYIAYIRDLNVSMSYSFQVKSIRYNKAFLVSILSNLISNAIKYRNNKRPLSIEVETVQIGQDIQLSVKDNGIGFDPEESESIFNKFTQSAPRREGSGLGLYLCKTSLPLLGDDIRAVGKPEEGATFTLIFRNKLP